MKPAASGWNVSAAEESLLENFRLARLDLFKKNDADLYRHLAIVISLLIITTAAAIFIRPVLFKLPFAAAAAFLWFSLINVTIHHHHTHHNAASGPRAKKILDFLYLIAMPNAPKRLSRYTRAHLNHHARPFDETDVDHHYGTRRFLRLMKKPLTAIGYYLELTFIGAHVPGWDDDQYMNTVPLEEWNAEGYEEVKKVERPHAVKLALIHWGAFFGILFAARFTPPGISSILNALAWGWALPMLLVKNWAHFLGQFQHYDQNLIDSNASILKRTKTYRCPSWLNYLAGGEISGHFVHHLFPQIPYYRVEEARKAMELSPALREFIIR